MSKITQLPEDTTPTGDDMMEIAHDPAGTPISRKVKILNLLKRLFLADNTQLTWGAVVDGEFLKRDGATITSDPISIGPATQIDETGGPTTLDIAAIVDGEFLKRVGTDIVSDSAPGGSIDPLVIEDANTVSQRNGLNAQEFRVYSSDNGAGVFGRLRIEKVSGAWRIVSETNSGSSDGDLQFYLGTGSAFLSFSGAGFFPGASGVVDLGSGANKWNEINAQNLQLHSTYVRWTAVDTELGSSAVGRLHVRRASNNGGGTGIQVGDFNANGFILKKGANGNPECRTGADDAYHQLTCLRLGVTNSVAASSLGTVTKKIEVFDAAGNSLGFIAVYDSIT